MVESVATRTPIGDTPHLRGPNPSFEQRWTGLARELHGLRREEDYSALWDGMIRSFSVEDASPTDALSIESRGYAFHSGAGLLPRAHEWMQLTLDGVARLGAGVATAATRVPSELLPRLISSAAHRTRGRGPRPKAVHDWRFPAIRRYLRRTGVDVEDWLSGLAGPARIKRSYNALKAVYLADRLAGLTGAHEWGGETALEIGAGTANLALLLTRSWRRGTYVIIDLPEMVLMGAAAVHTYRPDAEQVLPHEADEHSWRERLGGTDRLVFVFLTPEQSSLVPAASVRLALNVESFAEMDQATVDGYVELLYDVVEPRGLVFTANRESREIDRESGLSRITTFWNYPFRDSDDVILLEYCPMRDAVFRGRKRNINRLARMASL